MCEEIVTKHIRGKIRVLNEDYIYEGKSFTGALFEISIPIE